MPEFGKGLRPGEPLHREAARPVLGTHFPAPRYSAAALGRSSEVLGFDDEESRDHSRGPRFHISLTQRDCDARGR